MMTMIEMMIVIMIAIVIVTMMIMSNIVIMLAGNSMNSIFLNLKIITSKRMKDSCVVAHNHEGVDNALTSRSLYLPTMLVLF